MCRETHKTQTDSNLVFDFEKNQTFDLERMVLFFGSLDLFDGSFGANWIRFKSILAIQNDFESRLRQKSDCRHASAVDLLPLRDSPDTPFNSV